jgi:hypothetical protein
MDYQEHILDLLMQEVVKYKLVPVIDFETDTRGRILVMDKWEVAGSLHFDFGTPIITMSMGAPYLMIIGQRGNRQFTWTTQDPEDHNEEVMRLAKIWHLVLKEAGSEEKAAA